MPAGGAMSGFSSRAVVRSGSRSFFLTAFCERETTGRGRQRRPSARVRFVQPPTTSVSRPPAVDRLRRPRVRVRSSHKHKWTYPDAAAVLSPAFAAEALVLGRLCLGSRLLLRRRARGAAASRRLKVAFDPLDEAGVIPMLERVAGGVDCMRERSGSVLRVED